MAHGTNQEANALSEASAKGAHAHDPGGSMPRHNRGSPQTFGFSMTSSAYPQRPGSAATPRSFASRNDNGAAGGSESSITESLAA